MIGLREMPRRDPTPLPDFGDGQMVVLLQEMSEALGLGLVLQRPEILSRLNPADGFITVEISGRPRWLEIGGPDGPVVHRSRPDRKVVGLASAMVVDTALAALVETSEIRASANRAAARMLEPFVAAGRMPSRREAEAIQPWAALVEFFAYQLLTRASVAADLLRPSVMASFKGHGDGERLALVRKYWILVSLIARLSLLATTKGACPWLSEMAQSFGWVTWTPTFALVRERSAFLMAIAGRVAAAFGADIIDRYIAVLERAAQPMFAFDAVVGLTSIALSDERRREDIIQELRLRGRTSSPYDDDFVSSTCRGVLRVLADPTRTKSRASQFFRWRRGEGLGSRQALRSDGGSRLTDGDFLGFLTLPSAVDAGFEDFWPSAAILRVRPRFWPSDGESAELFATAWHLEHAGAAPTRH